MTKALGYAAKHSFSRLKPLAFERPAPKANEVEIDVLYCGVCHSDIHKVDSDWGNTVYPCMPSHEIVGGYPPSAAPSPATRSATWSGSAA